MNQWLVLFKVHTTVLNIARKDILNLAHLETKLIGIVWYLSTGIDL